MNICEKCHREFAQHGGSANRFCSMACRVRPLVDRFWSHVEKGDTCWVWTGGKTRNGYGSFGVTRERTARAHRMSWEIHFGAIPPGLFVCHRCDVRACVRPDHLFLGTVRENNIDCISKGRHPPPVHFAVRKSGLSQAQIEEIRSLYIPRKHSGMRPGLAKQFNVSVRTIENVLYNKKLRGH